MKTGNAAAICVPFVVSLLVNGVPPAFAEEEPPPEGEERIEATSKVEKKVEFTFTYSVRTHGFAKDAKPAKKDKSAKKAVVKPEEPAPEAPKPAMAVDIKGNRVTVSRLNILVNRTIDLGVTMDIHDREIRLTEFVKSQKDNIDVHFDTIDVISVVGGLETGDYMLIYTDVDGKEAYAGKINIK